VRSPAEEVDVPGVACLCFDALVKWHSGETAPAQATIDEAISLEKELNDMHGLAIAIQFAAVHAIRWSVSPLKWNVWHRFDRTVNASEFRAVACCGAAGHQRLEFCSEK